MNERPGRRDRWQELTKSECFGLLARERQRRMVEGSLAERLGA
jgi:hypothetical protein